MKPEIRSKDNYETISVDTASSHKEIDNPT